VRAFALSVASAGYAGFFPIAPGTAGAAVGVALWAAVRGAGAGLAGDIVLTATALIVGVWAAQVTERSLGVTDPGVVVIDEVMGMGLTLIGAPFTWPTAVAGFLLFRLFDIVKPPPGRRLERLHGGWGIMADDFAAGVYAWAALQAALWLAPAWLR
jgi:phosphatidylglycerophosphatase A